MQNSVAYPHVLKCRLLADLPPNDKTEFVDRCSAIVYPEPEVFLTQGETSPGVFIVAHGRIDAVLVGEGGAQTVLAHLGPGDTVGEVEAIADEPCVASCRAQALTTLLFCPTEMLQAYLRQPVMMRNVAAVFRSRLEKDNALKAVDQHGNLTQRLYLRLRTLSDARNRVRASQATLAEILGCSRQSVNKAMGRLRAEGIIDASKGEVRLLRYELTLDDLGSLLTE